MTDKKLTSDFYKANRRKLRESLHVDAIFISANGLLQKSGDQALPFRQDSSFWYLTSLNEPDLILVITKQEDFIIVPDIYIRREAVSSEFNKDQIAKDSAVSEVLSEKAGWQKVQSVLGNKKKVATLLPNSSLMKHYGMYANPARRQLLARLKRLDTSLQISDARRQLAQLRMVKHPEEIKLIQKAIDITSDTMKDVLSAGNIKTHPDSGQIERQLYQGFIDRGSSGHAFEPIVASGRNAAYIHFAKLNQPIKRGELIVCDVGCEYQLYSADLTRTISYGQPSSRQREVYEAVKDVQRQACKLLRPGVMPKEYEQQIEQMVGQKLKELGLIKRLSRSVIRRYYPHACSHSLGLDTHDSADYSIPLPEDMVMTVEPGIYIKEEGIGVRLEDVIRLTKNGHELMSKNLPTSLEL